MISTGQSTDRKSDGKTPEFKAENYKTDTRIRTHDFSDELVKLLLLGYRVSLFFDMDECIKASACQPSR